MSAIQIALLLLLCVVTYPFVLVVERVARARKLKPVYAIRVTDEQLRRERNNALFTTPIHPVTIAACILAGALRLAPENVGSVLFTFVLTFVWTEIYHYGLHRFMHLPRFHFMHREHHKSRITNAWTSISFSFWEEFAFAVGVMAFLGVFSQFHPLSLYGIVAYYLLYFSTNTIGHANIEINAPGYGQTLFGKIFTSSAYHAMHHARYVKNYGLLTVFMDRLFDSEWADSDAVQTRAARGQPLTELRERAEVAQAAAPAGVHAAGKTTA
jgi:sterol desaturase/sphingolipid hydroxylase (fatty acid hydroxylase superfamily)